MYIFIFSLEKVQIYGLMQQNFLLENYLDMIVPIQERGKNIITWTRKLML